MRTLTILGRSMKTAILALVIVGATDTAAQNDGPYSYGRQWNSWSPSSRLIYLQGFRDGQSHTYFALLGDLPGSRREALRLETFTMFDGDVLSNVITSLYADPANTFVQNDEMVYIARDKLSGKDVELMLRSARARVTR